MQSERIRVHRTAIIEEGADIGLGVVIGPFSYIAASAVIGRGSLIVGATIEGKIGIDCKVWRGAHVWDGGVIGDRCMLAQNVMVARARLGNNVRIQNESSIPHGSIIGDDVYIGAGVRLCNSAHPSALTEDELVPIRLHRGCSIGSNACIVGRVEIGEFAVVGAGAVVLRDVPASGRAVGVPANVHGISEFLQTGQIE